MRNIPYLSLTDSSCACLSIQSVTTAYWKWKKYWKSNIGVFFFKCAELSVTVTRLRSSWSIYTADNFHVSPTGEKPLRVYRGESKLVQLWGNSTVWGRFCELSKVNSAMQHSQCFSKVVMKRGVGWEAAMTAPAAACSSAPATTRDTHPRTTAQHRQIHTHRSTDGHSRLHTYIHSPQDQPWWHTETNTYLTHSMYDSIKMHAQLWDRGSQWVHIAVLNGTLFCIWWHSGMSQWKYGDPCKTGYPKYMHH